MTIYFLFCYARSGGTILNKVLKNINNMIILSEIHHVNESTSRKKKNKIISIKEQMKRWYNVEIEEGSYLSQINDVVNWCNENNKYLIIRDWTYIDFTPHKLNDFKPDYISNSLLALETKFIVKQIAFVRNSIDIFLSMNLDENVFFSSYLKYIEFLFDKKIKIFKYEDFCEDYKNTIKKIFKFWELEADITNNTPSNGGVVGDTFFSRGNQTNTIKKMDRRYSGYKNRKIINNNKDMIAANKLLGYKTTYESEKNESMIRHYLFRINRLLAKSIKIILRKV